MRSAVKVIGDRHPECKLWDPILWDRSGANADTQRLTSARLARSKGRRIDILTAYGFLDPVN
ncbi:hypothetical protein ACFWAY_26170 [Rhodococcus sp. NPDC059968]|uniref:hypothetical protein n=1 Tax=Rhodococcus sp. NPDC059968 TaxID=3347017 RepID=UPI0036712430